MKKIVLILTMLMSSFAINAQVKNWQANKSDNSSKFSDTTLIVNGVRFEMVYVEGGDFWMGAQNQSRRERNFDKNVYENESPVHHVTLNDYYIGRYEVTQEQWKAVMGTDIRQQRDKKGKNFLLAGEGDDYPMYYVSWNECQEFVEKLNELTGLHFSLPTEAQWEYAATGGCKNRTRFIYSELLRNKKRYKYSGDNNIESVAWHYNNSARHVHQVGTKAPNELDIYDMSGNVAEYCLDKNGNYNIENQDNPSGSIVGDNFVFRGGSWRAGARDCRVTYRFFNSPDSREDNIGFRLAL